MAQNISNNNCIIIEKCITINKNCGVNIDKIDVIVKNDDVYVYLMCNNSNFEGKHFPLILEIDDSWLKIDKAQVRYTSLYSGSTCKINGPVWINMTNIISYSICPTDDTIQKLYTFTFNSCVVTTNMSADV